MDEWMCNYSFSLNSFKNKKMKQKSDAVIAVANKFIIVIQKNQEGTAHGTSLGSFVSLRFH